MSGCSATVCLVKLDGFAAMKLSDFVEYQDVCSWKSEKRVREYLVGRWLVKELLGLPHNKPLGPYRSWEDKLQQKVSVSHTHGWVAVGYLGSGSIGVDLVECGDRRFETESLQQKILQNVDASSLAETLKTAELAKYAWAAKESSYKAFGGAVLLEDIQVRFEVGSNIEVGFATQNIQRNTVTGKLLSIHPETGCIVAVSILASAL